MYIPLKFYPLLLISQVEKTLCAGGFFWMVATKTRLCASANDLTADDECSDSEEVRSVVIVPAIPWRNSQPRLRILHTTVTRLTATNVRLAQTSRVYRHLTDKPQPPTETISTNVSIPRFYSHRRRASTACFANLSSHHIDTTAVHK